MDSMEITASRVNMSIDNMTEFVEEDFGTLINSIFAE